MKKLISLASAISILVACNQNVERQKDYVNFSGTITNPNSDSLIVDFFEDYKVIKVNTDGTFSDTLSITTGNYMIFDGKESSPVYLKNGYDLNLTLNTEEFDETIKYSGFGADPNNFLAEKARRMENSYADYEAIGGDSIKFNRFKKDIKDNLQALLKTTENLDSDFIASQEEEMQNTIIQFQEMFDERKALFAMNGSEAPKFSFENYAGGTTSLDDLKGKYVYIDLWATWCGPCKAEIPYLKKIEKEYHGKNISFVSISIDSKEDYEKWKSMVDEKELTGFQLYSNEDKAFTDVYKVTGIPRFILISPDGKTLNADAPRPSSDALKILFTSLNI